MRNKENNFPIHTLIWRPVSYLSTPGITRIERWNRAEKHGLNPSRKVKELVSAHLNDERYTQWYYTLLFCIASLGETGILLGWAQTISSENYWPFSHSPFSHSHTSSRLLIFLGSLYCKQFGIRSDCSHLGAVWSGFKMFPIWNQIRLLPHGEQSDQGS